MYKLRMDIHVIMKKLQNDYLTSIGNDLAKKFKHDSNIDNNDVTTSNVILDHESFKFDAITPDMINCIIILHVIIL